jgi:hypothetical protein
MDSSAWDDDWSSAKHAYFTLVVLQSTLTLRSPVEMERQIISGSVRKVLQQFTSTSLAKTLQIGFLSMADSLSHLD